MKINYPNFNINGHVGDPEIITETVVFTSGKVIEEMEGILLQEVKRCHGLESGIFELWRNTLLRFEKKVLNYVLAVGGVCSNPT